MCCGRLRMTAGLKTRCTTLSLLATAVVALSLLNQPAASVPVPPCRWQRFGGKFMADFAKHPGQVHHEVFSSLSEAQTDCMSIGSGCRGVTCTDDTETECTVRNHDRMQVLVQTFRLLPSSCL